MFFFFDEEKSPRASYLAFETYVCEALQKYVENQGKRFISVSDKFDAYLPDGIDDIKVPISVEIKYFTTGKKNIYFQSLLNFTSQINSADENEFLLILGDNFQDKSVESMHNLIKSKTSKIVHIWTLSTFNKKTEKYRDNNIEDINNPNSVLLDSAINSKSSQNDKNDAQRYILDCLKTKYKNEELALFLGAGISFEAGIPLWGELVNKLLSKMIASRFKETKISPEELNEIIDAIYKDHDDSSITQMRYIRSAFDDITYNKLVHEALYSKKPKINTDLLKAISSLCTPTRNHLGVQGIITYNFDDLIERRLTKDNVSVNSIFDENGCTNNCDLSIFHVHGYLPSKFDEEVSHELIFSEEDYHRVYRDAYCWSNIVQLNYLREKTCLFIGCSLTDPNLRRLLDVASRSNEKPRHYAILRRPQISKPSNAQLFNTETYKMIDMNIKENCFSMMGINVIWIDDFSEIPKILHWLKQF